VTRSLKDAYVARGGFRDEQVLVAPNGAPPPRPVEREATRPWPGRAGALQVGYAGQLYPGKGMEIVAALAPRMPEVEFHVLGGMEGDLSRWKRVAAAPNLHWHGFVPQRDLSASLARLDVALLPVQRHAQGYDRGRPIDIAQHTSPIKLFDYLAHGRAVIASDLPVLREVLDEEVARLAPPDDADAWIAALRELADPARREALARAGHRRWEERYTLEARARRIVQFAGSEK
jgi:glycosyltransferase involved in cell wall biosynthesis